MCPRFLRYLSIKLLQRRDTIIVYMLIYMNKKDGVDIKEEKADTEQDPNREDRDDVRLDGVRDGHWRMVFE